MPLRFRSAATAVAAALALTASAVAPRAAGAQSAAIAGAEKPLSLDDCVRLAEAAPSLASVALAGRQAAGFGVDAAVASFFPRVAWQSAVTFNSTVPGSDEPRFVALNGRREFQSALEATMDIDLSGKLRSGLARARADRAAADATAAVTIRDLRRAVAMAYYRTLLGRHLVDSTRDSLDEARSFEKRSQALFEGGEAARADVARARLQTTTLEQMLNTAELDARMASQDLASFWTANVGATLALEDVLVGPVPSPPDDESVDAGSRRVYLRRPEFRLLEAQREGFWADYRHARSGLFPQGLVKYQYGFDTLGFHWRDRGHALLLGLSVPLFDFFQTPSTYKPFRLRAQMVDLERQISERTFSRDYQSALARATMFYRQVDITDSQVKAAVENLNLARLRYDGGEGLALEVVSAQTQLTQSRANYYTARAAYLAARADLKVASGQ